MVLVNEITVGLRSPMQRLGLSSFTALAEKAGVTRWQLRQLRAGRAMQMRLGSLQQIAAALELSLEELLAIATEAAEPELQARESQAPEPRAAEPRVPESQAPESQAPEPQTSAAVLKQEYHRLQRQLEQQRESEALALQRQALYRLEAWMKNWPRVVHVVATQNPKLPAANVLALVGPVQQLLTDWGVETIGSVGESVPFDPAIHVISSSAQPASQSSAPSPQQSQPQPETEVEIYRPGYRHQEALLHRAEVVITARSGNPPTAQV